MLGLLLPVLGPILDKLVDRIPDPVEKERAKAEATKQLVDALTAADAAQVEVNKVEAASASVFVAGWRPAVGWICAAGVGYQYVARPLLQGLVTLWQARAAFTMPAVETGDLLYLLGCLLGVAGLRTVEKIKGAAR
jgi:hypothetical protein